MNVVMSKHAYTNYMHQNIGAKDAFAKVCTYGQLVWVTSMIQHMQNNNQEEFISILESGYKSAMKYRNIQVKNFIENNYPEACI